LVGGRESVGKSTIFLPNKTPLLRIGQWGEISEGDELIRQPLPDLEPPRSSLDGAFNILYTSGSSGPSKGVVGRERGFVYRIGWMHQAFPFIKDKELVLRRTPLAFVDSVWEIWGALLAGVP
jgi:non-ribosomal peptide synthetase component F